MTMPPTMAPGMELSPPQHHRRQDQESQVSHGNIEPVDIPQQGAAHSGCHERDGPCRCIDKPGAHPKGEGRHFVIGRGLHGKPPPGVFKKAYEDDQQYDGGYKTP